MCFLMKKWSPGEHFTPTIHPEPQLESLIFHQSLYGKVTLFCFQNDESRLLIVVVSLFYSGNIFYLD